MKTKPKQKLPYTRYLLTSNLANCVGFGMFLPLFGTYVIQLGLDPSNGSFIWSTYTFAVAIFMLAFGRAENSIKNKINIIVVGNAIQVLGALLILLVESSLGLIAGLLLYGLGTSILAPTWYYLYSKTMDKKRGPEEWSWSSSGASFATAAGAALGGLIYIGYGFLGVFMAMLGFLAVGLVAIVRFRTIYRRSL